MINNNTNIYNHPDSPISTTVKSILLLTFEIPSLICHLLLFVAIISQQSYRSVPSNYIMIYLLVLGFIILVTDIPFVINYCFKGSVLSHSPSFCLFWWFIDMGVFYESQILVAWASIERHLLIFHDRCFSKKWKLFSFHYLPPIILLIYTNIFYIYVIYFPSCENIYIYEIVMCGFPCYVYDPILGLWESIFHGILPTLCILIFNIALLLRVYCWKNRFRQTIKWKNYRRMILQLVSTSILHLTTNFPLCILYIFYMSGFLNWTERGILVLSYLSYFIHIFFPFIFITYLRETSTKFKTILQNRFNRRINVR